MICHMYRIFPKYSDKRALANSVANQDQARDTTPLGWLGRKTSTQTNKQNPLKTE